MDLEFHYYITHLIAARAGFSNGKVKTIAYSSQYTVDNTFIFNISIGTSEEYSNYISQTMDILKPQMDLFRIYPLFHFIQGDPLSATARRKDGKMHRLITTPDSENANKIFYEAAKSNNLYRLGIACHAYADTFAHQNFVGYYDVTNSFAGLLEAAIPNIGHACALHKPDWPGLV